ncbi:MAG TPA: hypothetical protein VJL57_00225 [Candidatus Paceibacterota bacterium]
MTLIKNLIIALVGIALALGLYVVVKHSGLIQPLGQKEEDTATTTPSIVEEKAHSITYRNNTYGIAFQYPERYVMEENSAVDGNGYSMHWITLFRSQDFPLPQNGERPPEITITIIEMKGQSLFEWLKKGNSNYSPEDGMSSALASTTVSGVEAVHYTWSGLYEGETTAFLHKDNVVAVSVTYLSPEEEHVAVYRNLLQSLEAH